MSPESSSPTDKRYCSRPKAHNTPIPIKTLFSQVIFPLNQFRIMFNKHVLGVYCVPDPGGEKKPLHSP